MKNPTGARCDVYDHAVNVWGKDPKTGFARRPLDNVGIQYGLGALNSGVITQAAVPRPEREDRRLRQRRQGRRDAHGRGSGRDARSRYAWGA